MASSPAIERTIVRYGKWRNQFIVAPVAVALAVFFWRIDGKGTGFWIAIGFLIGLAVFSLLPSDTVFDTDRRHLERRWSLFGVFPVFRRQVSLGQFHRICWRRYITGESNEWRTWMVGFERNSGQPLYLNYFNVKHDGPCREAQQFAMELSELTGLPLSEEIRTVSKA